ncbi:trehalose operon repressor [Dellaglioa algida]|nr:trehalose operon repressor [Dellaglioa algida]
MTNQNKYLGIYQDLVTKITHNIYEAGTFLPSETQLSELYGSSRETIRKALQNLLTNGYIQKIRGKGSLVLDVKRFVFPVSGITSYKELDESLQMDSETKVLQLTKLTIPTGSFAPESVVGDEATFIERLRLVKNEPSVIDRDYILSNIVPTVPLTVAQNSIYEYFENKLGLEISYAVKKITVEPADPTVQKLLDIPETESVVVVRSETYLQDSRLFQITEAIHRADRFSFVEFARRIKK